MSTIKFVVLGSGTSTGVPSIEHGWGVCDPLNIKNRRTRSSFYIETNKVKVLIDTSPDLKDQLINNNIKHLDAILYTHAHADHSHGLNDLRGINRLMESSVDAYMDESTKKELLNSFGYAFKPLEGNARGYYKPVLNIRDITFKKSFFLGDLEITPLMQDHGYSKVCSFIIKHIGSNKRVAVLTDYVDISTDSIEYYKDLDLFVSSCIGYKKHPTHIHLEGLLGIIRDITPKKTLITHMSSAFDYDELLNRLPSGVYPSFDGLSVTI